MATDTIPKPRLTGLGAIQLHFDRERKQLGDRYREEMAAAATHDEREQLTDTYLGARYALQADEERALSRHFALYPDQWRSRGKPLRELVRWDRGHPPHPDSARRNDLRHHQQEQLRRPQPRQRGLSPNPGAKMAERSIVPICVSPRPQRPSRAPPRVPPPRRCGAARWRRRGCPAAHPRRASAARPAR